MSTFAEELIDHLVTESVITAKGTDGFVGRLPDTSGLVVVLKDTGGPQVPHGTPLAQTTIQMMVRQVKTGNIEGAQNLAAKVYNVFHGMVGVDLAVNHVASGTGLGRPADIGQDANGRHLVSGNFLFETYRLTASGEASSGYEGDKDPNL